MTIFLVSIIVRRKHVFADHRKTTRWSTEQTLTCQELRHSERTSCFTAIAKHLQAHFAVTVFESGCSGRIFDFLSFTFVTLCANRCFVSAHAVGLRVLRGTVFYDT